MWDCRRLVWKWRKWWVHRVGPSGGYRWETRGKEDPRCGRWAMRGFEDTAVVHFGWLDIFIKSANGARCHKCHNQTIEWVVAVEKGNWQVGWGDPSSLCFYFNVWFWCVPYLVALYQSHASSARTVHVTSDGPSICYEITSKAVNF